MDIIVPLKKIKQIQGSRVTGPPLGNGTQGPQCAFVEAADHHKLWNQKTSVMLGSGSDWESLGKSLFPVAISLYAKWDSFPFWSSLQKMGWKLSWHKQIKSSHPGNMNSIFHYIKLHLWRIEVYLSNISRTITEKGKNVDNSLIILWIELSAVCFLLSLEIRWLPGIMHTGQKMNEIEALMTGIINSGLITMCE